MAYAYQYTGSHGVHTIDGTRYIQKGDRVASLSLIPEGRHYRFVLVQVPDEQPALEPAQAEPEADEDQEPEVSDD